MINQWIGGYKKKQTKPHVLYMESHLEQPKKNIDSHVPISAGPAGRAESFCSS